MIRKILYRKIVVASSLLLVILLLYLIPVSPTIKENITYKEPLNNAVIYLIDESDYVSRVNINIDSTDSLSIANKLLDNLLDKDLIPKNFYSVLPPNTKVLDISLKDEILKINFSKEFTNIKLEDEDKLFESLIYTLTSIKGISKLDIYIEGSKLDKLPISKKTLPNYLDKSYGINKKYELTNLNNVLEYTIYYTNRVNNDTYYIPVTKYVNNENQDKVKVIIDELASNLIYETNLSSYLDSNTKLLNYEIIDKTIKLNFNDMILSSITENVILEEVMYTIGLSIYEEYDINKVIFNVDNKEVATLNLE